MAYNPGFHMGCYGLFNVLRIPYVLLLNDLTKNHAKYRWGVDNLNAWVRLTSNLIAPLAGYMLIRKQHNYLSAVPNTKAAWNLELLSSFAINVATHIFSAKSFTATGFLPVFFTNRLTTHYPILTPVVQYSALMISTEILSALLTKTCTNNPFNSKDVMNVPVIWLISTTADTALVRYMKWNPTLSYTVTFLGAQVAGMVSNIISKEEKKANEEAVQEKI